MDFYTDMASFDASGIAPYRAMSKMRDVARPRRSMRWFVTLLNPVLRAVSEGAGMAKALRPWIPPEEAAMLEAGERTGQLRSALSELSELLQQQLEIRGALMRNLLPAGAMMLVLVALVVFIFKTVLTQAKTLVPPEILEHQLIAPVYFAFGEWLLTWGWLAGLIGVAFVVVVALSLPRWRPDKLRRWLDAHLPPYTLYTRVQSVFFMVACASMMRAGQPFRSAAEDLQRHAVPWVRAHVRRMLARLAGGQNEVRSMQVGMLPWDSEDRLAIYAELPEFREVMHKTARDSMKVLLRRVNGIGKAMNVLVMLCLAFFIILTVFSLGEIALAIQDSLKQMQAR